MRIYGYVNFGYEGELAEAECDIRDGEPGLDIIGVYDSSAEQTRELVRKAAESSGLELPKKRILVSLSPADLRKDGLELAFPAALAILKGNNFADERVLCVGNLAEDGENLPVRAARAAVGTAVAAGIRYAVLPKSCKDMRFQWDMKVCFAGTLLEAMDALESIGTGDEGRYFSERKETVPEEISFRPYEDGITDETPFLPELSETAVRAVIAAAAGKHHILMWGGRDSGKSLALRQLKFITPTLTAGEKGVRDRIWSVAGLDYGGDCGRGEPFAPFRMPPKSATIEKIFGGGVRCYPGNVSLAHGGVLFLDEAAEFRTSVLQMLRLPVENGYITLSHAGRATIYPARFQLAMTASPCPCGNFGDKDRLCFCRTKSIEMYWRKFSAPLLDQIDITVMCGPRNNGERIYTFGEVRNMVRTAIGRQRERGVYNGNLSVDKTAEIKFSGETQNLLSETEERLGLSQRKSQALLNLSRTFADIDGRDSISVSDVRNAASVMQKIPAETD